MTRAPSKPGTEMTPLGEQTLIAGVRPITDRDRLQMRLEAPLQPRCRQKPLNLGLWDEGARNQLELFAPAGGMDSFG